MHEGEISTERQTENQTANQPELPPVHPQKNENKLLKFVKKNAVCCIAFCLALVTSFIVPPFLRRFSVISPDYLALPFNASTSAFSASNFFWSFSKRLGSVCRAMNSRCDSAGVPSAMAPAGRLFTTPLVPAT